MKNIASPLQCYPQNSKCSLSVTSLASTPQARSAFLLSAAAELGSASATADLVSPRAGPLQPVAPSLPAVSAGSSGA